MDERQWDRVIEPLARVGYETMFEDKWDDLAPNSIERALWKQVATQMLKRLWQLYQMRSP